uniref:Uncharacterized protein n=1 Tax=Rhizophora mucronata TaxID=61149 RepID=A0A2P2N8Y6_RHIMU
MHLQNVRIVNLNVILKVVLPMWLFLQWKHWIS